MSETYLITGGAGYVGSHVAAELVARGHAVVVLDDLSQGHAEAVPPGATLIRGDLADRRLLESVFVRYRFAGVLHFAARSLVGESMRQPWRYLRDNTVNALNLIETAVAFEVQRFVLSSTCAIFAPTDAPLAEDAPVGPASPYGESKHMIERLLDWAERVYRLRSACLRYFNAAGAHPVLPLGEDHWPETHLVPLALEVALGQRPHLEIHGDDWPTPDGTCIRDYVHVMDLADAHVRVLDALEQGSRRYNLGIGRGFSVHEVIEAARRVTGHPIPTRVGPRRAGDPARLVADPTRARRELGWAPRCSELEALVATAWAWKRSHPAGYASRAAA
ncbi:MAG TPA: UDP-glucose 4-epimerase GalE [Geminicoccaceae bacterium]|nr:UDP-glucose 4-epimerase GalE [Geminicoccaceae bacterium]